MKRGFDLWIALLSALGLFFLTMPVLVLIFSTSPESFIFAIRDREFLGTLKVSILSATFSSLFVLLLGTPISYILARKTFPFKGILEHLVDLPIAIPHSVSGIAILYFFGRTSPVGQMLNIMGIKVYGDMVGIVLAMSFVSAPYYIASVKEGLSVVPREYESVSYSLGRGRAFTFFRVILPMARSHLFKGLILSWGRALSEFGAVMVVAYYPMTATVFIYERLESLGIKSTLPYAVIVLLLSGGLFVTFRVLWGRYAQNRRS